MYAVNDGMPFKCGQWDKPIFIGQHTHIHLRILQVIGQARVSNRSYPPSPFISRYKYTHTHSIFRSYRFNPLILMWATRNQLYIDCYFAYDIEFEQKPIGCSVCVCVSHSYTINQREMLVLTISSSIRNFLFKCVYVWYRCPVVCLFLVFFFRFGWVKQFHILPFWLMLSISVFY